MTGSIIDALNKKLRATLTCLKEGHWFVLCDNIGLKQCIIPGCHKLKELDNNFNQEGYYNGLDSVQR